MKNAKRNQDGRRLLGRVWTCALVLALLAVVSLSSVGAYAATYASRDPEVLFLDAASGEELSQAFDLFKNAYVNAEGQTVVASEDGTKVIAPGTSGDYEFAVRNTGGQPATYEVWAETSQDGTTTKIPLTVTMASGSIDCQNLADAGELAPGNSAIYRIEWSWPFAAAATDAATDAATADKAAATDARDTSLGNQAVSRRATYTVTIHARAEAEYPPAQANGGRAPFTGEKVLPVALLVAAGLALAGVAVFFYLRNRRDDNQKARR